MEFLTLKTKITKMEKRVDELNRKLSRQKKKMSKWEDVIIQIIQFEEPRGKRWII